MEITNDIGSQIKFLVCGDTKAPTRGEGNAGIDLYFPNLNERLLKDLSEKNPGQPFRWGLVGAPKDGQDPNERSKGVYLYLPAHEDIVIPAYVKARFPKNICLKVAIKSGVASNQKLLVGAEIIDSSHEGEIMLHVFNMSNTIRFLEFGQKLAQLIPVMIDNQPIEVFYDAELQEFSEFENTVTEADFYNRHAPDRGEEESGEDTGNN